MSIDYKAHALDVLRYHLENQRPGRYTITSNDIQKKMDDTTFGFDFSEVEEHYEAARYALSQLATMPLITDISWGPDSIISGGPSEATYRKQADKEEKNTQRQVPYSFSLSPMDRGRLINAMIDVAVESFTERDWLEFGNVTNSTDLISAHPRLLRSLKYKDADYSDVASRIITRVLAEDESRIGRALEVSKLWSGLQENHHDALVSLSSGKRVSVCTPPFNEIAALNGLAPLLASRWREAEECLKIEAYTACLVLLGSILEGVLLGVLRSNIEMANRAPSAPKDKDGKVLPIRQWTLSAMIEVARQCGFAKESFSKYANNLREYRNYIHPNEAAKKDDLTYTDCNLSIIALEGVIRDLTMRNLAK